MADFARRGFRLDRPEARAVLEGHARSFLTGFNLAVAHPRGVHEALSTVPEQERGFAYEGAGMYARLLDVATMGAAGALGRLLAGPGEGYVHLVHVGAGWGLTAARVPALVPLPSTPLLRWLALDGAGFGRTYFGGMKALRRIARREPARATAVHRWQTEVSGCGRALWFVQSADPDGIAGEIAELPERARPWLWAGVGLAAGYAGATSEDGLRALAAQAGRDSPFLAQGIVFAGAARMTSRVVPAHTELACQTVLGIGADDAKHWSDVAAEGLTGSSGVDAYALWRSRLRARAARAVA